MCWTLEFSQLCKPDSFFAHTSFAYAARGPRGCAGQAAKFYSSTHCLFHVFLKRNAVVLIVHRLGGRFTSYRHHYLFFCLHTALGSPPSGVANTSIPFCMLFLFGGSKHRFSFSWEHTFLYLLLDDMLARSPVTRRLGSRQIIGGALFRQWPPCRARRPCGMAMRPPACAPPDFFAHPPCRLRSCTRARTRCAHARSARRPRACPHRPSEPP